MVSIITNCFNGERYLHETIKSVLNQTYQDWEYILFDNNSSDKSADIFLSYKDSRFRYYKNDITVPLGHGRCQALKMAKGDYVCFIDSDDIWLPTNLEKQVEMMEIDSSVGVVYTDYQRFGADSSVRKTSPQGYRCLADVMNFYDLGLSSTMFRNSLLKIHHIEINNSYNLIADYDLFIRLIRISKCYHIKENLVLYRVHSNNLTNTVTNGYLEYEQLYQSFLLEFSESEKKACKKGLRLIVDNIWENKFNQSYANHHYLSAIYNLIHVRNYRFVLVRIFLMITDFIVYVLKIQKS